ncbi:MAG TPA: amino acid adenylation domain-containing protein, partial [Streptosporangiaceae bacterium]|nr:amino acid adenylation domain-containing protein [Streptosporangiaceae bacterium]
EVPGAEAGFFELGGHSLLAMRLVSRIRRVLGAEISVRDVFEHPTAAGLAALASGAARAGAGIPPEIPRASGSDVVSYAQRRVWFVGQLDPASPEFNVSTAWRIRGDLDTAVLRTALARLVARHQVLSTRIVTVDGDPVCQAASGDFSWQERDRSGQQGAAEEATAMTYVREEALRPFDVSVDPLLRVSVLRLGAGDVILLLVVHHLAFDGWSTGIFLRELAELYAAGLDGRPAELPELPIQYQDFAAWQRDWLRDSHITGSVEYWRRQLAGLQPVELPADFPRGKNRSWKGGSVEFELPQEVTSCLRQLARDEQATPFIVLLSAFQLLVGRYAAVSDVAVGTPVAGRNMAETQSLIGLFFNAVVLRTDLSGDLTFGELVRRVRATAVDAYAHDQMPFEWLLEELRPERDLSRSPLFQVWFEMDTASESPLELPGLDIREHGFPTNTVKYDVSVSIRELGDRIGVHIGYRQDLFRPQTMERFAAGFRALVAQAAADPARRCSELPVMPEQDYQQVVMSYNDTATEVPAGCVHEWFERQARQRPEAVALVCGELQQTFGELNERANRLAGFLRDSGAVTVGVCVRRGPDLVTALLGVLKSGAAYVPLDPAFPAARLEFMLEDSQADLLLTEGALGSTLPGYQGRQVCLDAGWPLISRYSGENGGTAARPDSLAYIIYTSGSTGRPKGVMVEHGGLANFVHWCAQGYACRGGTGAPVFSSVAFDAVVPNLYTPLVLGHPVHLLPHDIDMSRLGEHLAEAGPFSFIKLTPSHLDLLADQLTPAQARGLAGTLVVGAEAFPASSLRLWQDKDGDTVILNEYGPTEATVANSTYNASAGVTSTIVPIGRPIPNTTMYVLDRSLQPAPIGAVGELYIGGGCVARGYHRRPGLTATTFVADPFTARPGTRLYRTGDLGRMLPDGNIEFICRVDDQVKIRGYRIEPGEIESMLTSHPSVGAAHVRLVQGAGTAARLIGYIVPSDPDDVPDPAELLGYLAGALPQYMVPSELLVIDEMPLTPHGKIDRHALPSADRAPDEEYVAPRTAAEQAVAKVWSDVLGAARVGIHDNFFALGGDSILSIKVASRLKESGIAVTPQEMFQHQTIAALLTRARRSAPVLAEQGTVSGPADLSPIQRWFLAQQLPMAHHYNQAVVLASGVLDPAILGRVLTALVDHHDELRARFSREEGGWVQEIRAQHPGGLLTYRDLRELNEADRESGWLELARDAQASLDLARGEVFRAVLAELGHDAGQRLLLIAHHLVVDTVSWSLLLDDLDTAYRQVAAGQIPQLPAKTTSFQAWSARLAEHVRSTDFAADSRYWTARRAAAPPPVSLGRTGTVTQVVSHEVCLTAEQTSTLLHQAPGTTGSSVEDILLAALAIAVSRWSGAADVLIDIEGHGREQLFKDMDVSRTVGWFTTLHPLELTVADSSDLARVVRDTALRRSAVPHKGIGYGILAYLGDPATRQRIAAQPQPDILFNYLGNQVATAVGPIRVTDAPDGTTVDSRNPPSHPLTVTVIVADGILSAQVQAACTAGSPDRGDALAASYAVALADILQQTRDDGLGGDRFRYAPVNRAELATIASMFQELAMDNIEDIYPLAPLQKGLIFHSLYDPQDREAPYVVQSVDELAGPLSSASLRDAWQLVTDRHQALRTCFVWEGVTDFVQVVQRRVPVQLAELDWSADRTGNQEAMLAGFLAADREQGFDLSRAPLFRVTVIRTAPDRHLVVMSHHHLLLDGWSVPIVGAEVLTAYQAINNGTPAELGEVVPYVRYLDWLSSCSRDAAADFWRDYLRGHSGTTRIASRDDPELAGFDGIQISIPERATAGLYALCRARHLTFNTLVQGALAYVLGFFAGQDDVVFGSVVSTRPPALDGVESIVGLLINTLPVRVRISPGMPASAWFARLQQEQAAAREFDYASLSDIRSWSGLPGGTRLFDCLMVFYNLPAGASSAGGSASTLSRRPRQSVERTGYPLTVTAHVDEELHAAFCYDPASLHRETVQRMADGFAAVLEVVAGDADVRLSGVGVLSAGEAQRVVGEWNETGVAVPGGLLPELFE